MLARVMGFWTLVLGLAAAPSSAAPASSDEAASRLSPSHLAGLKWRSIGPALTSGRIADVAVVESVEPKRDIVYVAAATGGAWKTTNGGTTWEPIFENGATPSLGDARREIRSPRSTGGTGARRWPFRITTPKRSTSPRTGSSRA